MAARLCSLLVCQRVTRSKKLQLVEAGVGGDVRVVGGHERDVQVAGSRYGAPQPEYERVHGVDQVGFEAAQRESHAGVYGGELDLGVRRERHAGDPVDRHPLVRARPLPVLRGDHEHLVAHPEQLLDGVPEPRDDTVRGRKEGLGEERDPQTLLPGPTRPYRFETMAWVNSLVPALPPRSLVRVSGLFRARSIPACILSASSS